MLETYALNIIDNCSLVIILVEYCFKKYNLILISNIDLFYIYIVYSYSLKILHQMYKFHKVQIQNTCKYIIRAVMHASLIWNR